MSGGGGGRVNEDMRGGMMMDARGFVSRELAW